MQGTRLRKPVACKRLGLGAPQERSFVRWTVVPDWGGVLWFQGGATWLVEWIVSNDVGLVVVGGRDVFVGLAVVGSNVM